MFSGNANVAARLEGDEMRRSVNALGVTVALLIAMMALAGQAAAAATQVANDNFADAEEIVSFPFTEEFGFGDEATAESSDPVACLGTQHPHTVWYHVTAPRDGDMQFFVSTIAGAGVVILDDSLTVIACSYNVADRSASVIRTVSAGDSIYFMAALEDPSTALVSVRYLIPQPTVTLVVDRSATLSKTGTVTVTGELMCDVITTGSVTLSLTQSRGRKTATSTGGVYGVPCTPDGTRWAVALSSQTETAFSQGDATVAAQADAYGDLGNGSASTDAIVRIRKG